MPELIRPAPPLTWRDRLTAATDWIAEHPVAAVIATFVAASTVGALGFVAARPSLAGPPPPLQLPMTRGATGAGAEPGPTGAEVTPAVGGASLVVHVAGAVNRPGLVRLAGTARAADAIDAAGGLRADADVDRLNLAAKVADGQRLYVPVRGQEVPTEVGGEGGDPTSPASGVVNINTATLDQLETLPGVGAATAQAIVDYRRSKGRFRRVDELLEVRGIGPAKLASIRSRVRV